MRTRLYNSWERLRANFWFVPALMVAGAMVLAFLMIGLDQVVGSDTYSSLGWTYTRGPEGARQLLSTVAGSVITVAGVTFSITIATLTLASSQFGPRLLRSFLRDRGNQLVLGTFIATFIYCLLVLRTVHGDGDGFSAFVPNLAVAVAVGLAVASIGVLIYFIHHVSVSMQVDNLIAILGRELDDAIDRLYPEKLGHAKPEHTPPPPTLPPVNDGDVAPVQIEDSGYVQLIDTDSLMQITTDHDVTVQILSRPGDFVVHGAAIARIWPAGNVDDGVADAVRGVVVVGSQRTLTQDITFPIQQIVEIAVRALSPGINDPFTAISCIDRLGAALCRLAGRSLPDEYRFGDDERLRVVAPPVSFAQIVEAAFDDMRQYGRTSAAVLVRLLETIAVVAARAHDDDLRTALRSQVDMIMRGAVEGLPEELDRDKVATRHQEVLSILGERVAVSAR